MNSRDHQTFQLTKKTFSNTFLPLRGCFTGCLKNVYHRSTDKCNISEVESISKKVIHIISIFYFLNYK